MGLLDATGVGVGAIVGGGVLALAGVAFATTGPSAIVAFVLVAVPNIAAAGAMSSLIFLSSFAIAHGIAYLVRIRAKDRSPLILVPIANPATLMTVADALAPHSVARVLLLSVVKPPAKWTASELPHQLVDAQSILGSALSTALEAELRPEALITLSDNPWAEITRVAERYRCDSLLLGVGYLGPSLMTGPLEELMSRVEGDVVILRAPSNWDLDQVRRVLVPAGGRRDQSQIRARLIGNLSRGGVREITYLRVLPATTDSATERRARRELRKLARDEAPGVSTAAVTLHDDVVAEVVTRAADSDLLILGLQRLGRRRKVFGERVLEIAQSTTCPLVMISRRS
jgi:nucleotide-binding universal stress UspA family protein